MKKPLVSLPLRRCRRNDWLGAFPPAIRWLLWGRGRLVAAALAMGCCCQADGLPPEKVFDLVIRQGRIVDGTGNPWFTGDIALRGDRIAAISRRLLSEVGDAEVVNAEGLVVAPGFVDIHSHSDWILFEDGRGLGKVFQGVTTEILGEGGSAGPFKGKLVPRPVSVQGRVERVDSMGRYFDLIDEAEVGVNVASYVGLGNVWQSVMGHSFDSPTEGQLAAMKSLLGEAMDQGALGLSCQLMMPPGLLVATDQLVELCAVVRAGGGIFSTHIRNEGQGVFEAVRQAIEVGERARLPVDIIHLKIADQAFWGRMSEVIELIEQARRRGVNVQANVYPYTRGNNNLSSIIPPWAHEGGRTAMLARLRDPELRDRLKQDIRKGIEGWYNHFTAVGGDWRRMLISANNRYQGMTMDQVIGARRRTEMDDSLDLLFELLLEFDGSVGTVYAHHTESDMNLAMKQPWCSIGSDGAAYAVSGILRRGNPHPRNFGTFPRVLGHYVRERGLLTLEDAVRKMTSLNAIKVGLSRRGLIKEGWYADLVVFDEDEVMDRATYTDPFQYGVGMVHVLVNGQFVIRDRVPTEKKPGRALRR